MAIEMERKGLMGKGGSRGLVSLKGDCWQTKRGDRCELRKMQTTAKWVLLPKSKQLCTVWRPSKRAEELRRLTRGSAIPGQ